MVEDQFVVVNRPLHQIALFLKDARFFLQCDQLTTCDCHEIALRFRFLLIDSQEFSFNHELFLQSIRESLFFPDLVHRCLTE